MRSSPQFLVLDNLVQFVVSDAASHSAMLTSLGGQHASSCVRDAFFPGQLNSISMFTVQVPRMQPAPLQSHLLWERKHPQVGNSDQCWTLQLEIGIGLGLWTGRRHQTISVCASCFHPDYFFCSLRFFHPGQSASFYRGRGTCWH